MKKLLWAALALAMATPAVASADATDRRGDGRWERHHDRDGRWNRGDHHRRDGRWDRDDHRRHGDWDRRHHDRSRTRVIVRPQYHYYSPPRTYYAPPVYSYHQPRWHRGGHLPPHYRRHVVYDYYNYGYGPPPHGHAYYRTDTGDIILAAIATGLILSVIAGGW